MSNSNWKIPNDEDISPDDIQPEADLFDADLSGAGLRGADLTDANLRHAALTDAKLFDADLTDANLFGADLTDANLFDADLSGAGHHGADLSKAHLGDVTLADSTLARSTEIDAPGTRIRHELADEDAVAEEHLYDFIARANHELRTAYSANGLISQARSARVRERRARRREALAEEGLLSWGTAAWFGSLLSKVFTGYGVQLTWIGGVMAALYLSSVAVYSWEGMPIDQSLYYSVVTFTTAPPTAPSEVGFGTVGRLAAGIETFAGTAAIVFLGYVLGTRERV